MLCAFYNAMLFMLDHSTMRRGQCISSFSSSVQRKAQGPRVVKVDHEPLMVISERNVSPMDDVEGTVPLKAAYCFF